MALPDSIDIEAHEFSGAGVRPVTVKVGAEYHFTLEVNGRAHMTIACSGTDLEELALGHVISEGMIPAARAEAKIDVDEGNFIIRITLPGQPAGNDAAVPFLPSASSRGRAFPDIPPFDDGMLPAPNAAMIIGCMDSFLGRSSLHQETRGVHSAALYTIDGEELLFFDEIGRHNAIDKIVGRTAGKGENFRDRLLFTTGRVSSEIIGKAVRAGLAAVISKASPSSRGVELARRQNMLLVGRVWNDRFTAFSRSDRITSYG